MSKRVSKAASQELAFLAALESIHADVDISKIAEIQDWSRAVRGKLYGASIKGTSHIPNPQASVPLPIVTNAPSPPRVVLGASGNVASHGSVQYSQMAIPQLVAVGISESSGEAWSEFVLRSQPLIRAVITKVVRRFGNASQQLVDDLTQDVYLKICVDDFRALRGVATTDNEKSLFGFLKVVAANVAHDYFRRAAAFRAGGAHAPEQESIEVNRVSELDTRKASSAIERKVLLEEIDRRLKTLSHEPNFARDRAIFWLYYSQGLPAKEIAGLPGVKLGVKAVKSTLLRLPRYVKSALIKEPKKSKSKLWSKS